MYICVCICTFVHVCVCVKHVLCTFVYVCVSMYYVHLCTCVCVCVCVCVCKHALCTFVHVCVLLSLHDDFRNKGNLKSRFHGAVCHLKNSLFTAKSNSRNCNQFRSFDSFYNNNNVPVAKINQNCVVKCLYPPFA